MAQRTVVTMTDAIDGSVAVETVTFGLDAGSFEIDLTAEHAAALRAVFEPFVTAGRRTGGAGRLATVSAVKVVTGYSAPAVRAWAASRNIDIPARGRIPSAVVEQYQAAGK
ncbi:MAG TPA: Lsr2 family protein [Propionicimonas sp.]|jgi:hypothetical protein